MGDAVFRGQYSKGIDNFGEVVKGYREEDRINPESDTETFIAMRLMIDNWRWAGVPIMLRTGKRMAKKTTEIAVQFKTPPLELFKQVECNGGDICDITKNETKHFNFSNPTK